MQHVDFLIQNDFVSNFTSKKINKIEVKIISNTKLNISFQVKQSVMFDLELIFYKLLVHKKY